jgi:hypothetical protein
LLERLGEVRRRRRWRFHEQEERFVFFAMTGIARHVLREEEERREIRASSKMSSQQKRIGGEILKRV